jgi:hypothetical protein
MRVVERQDASREEFEESGYMIRMLHLAQTQDEAVQEWARGLLNAAQRIEPPEE